MHRKKQKGLRCYFNMRLIMCLCGFEAKICGATFTRKGPPELPDTLLKICGRGHLVLNVRLPWPSHSWRPGGGTMPDFCHGINTHLCTFMHVCGLEKTGSRINRRLAQLCRGMSGMQIRSLVHRSEGSGGGDRAKVVKGEVKAKGEDKEEGR